MLIAVVGSCRTTYAEATSQCRQNITDFHNFYNSKETICLNPEIMPPKFKFSEGERVLCHHGPLLYEIKVGTPACFPCKRALLVRSVVILIIVCNK